jgi:ketosteroid isomerase-like protein
MAGEAADRLRRSIEEFNRTGEVPPGLLDPSFEIHQAASIIDTAGVFRGPNASQESLGELSESFEDMTFEPKELIEAPGGRVVVMIRAHARGKGSGLKIDNHIAWVFTLRDGKAVRLEIYEEQAEALKAVGLAD